MASMMFPSRPICGVTLRMIPSVSVSGEKVTNSAEVVEAGVTVARKKTSCRPIRMIALWLFRGETFGGESTLTWPCLARASRNASNFVPATPIWKAVFPLGSVCRTAAPPVRDPDREREERSGKAVQLIPYCDVSSRVISKMRVSIMTPALDRDSRVARYSPTCCTRAGESVTASVPVARFSTTLPPSADSSDCTSSTIPDQKSNFSSVFTVLRLWLSPPADDVPLADPEGEEEEEPEVEVEAVSDPEPTRDVRR